MSLFHISCPDCGTGLDVDSVSGMNYCPVCNHCYTVADGIVDFNPDEKFYWGEVSREAMLRVNDRAEKVGWFPAFLEEVAEMSDRHLPRYLLDPIRIAGLFHYYNPERNMAALDLGSGWGPISFGLSQFYQSVYSLDGVYERLRFQAIRAEQDRIANVKILKSTLQKLPFSDNSMDAVVVNGVLEWVGLSDTITDPRELQIQFLKETLRVLKPGGTLLIGIENRTAAEFVLGSRDHSGLRFTSLMPRWLASLAVRLFRRMETTSIFSGAEASYRTYTYTYWGYRDLLKQVGYCQPDIYWTWPDYSYPLISGPLDGDSVKHFLSTVDSWVDKRWKKVLLRILRFFPAKVLGFLMKVFSSCFLIVASKSVQVNGLQAAVLNSKASGSFIRATLDSRTSLKTSFLLTDGQGVNETYEVVPSYLDGQITFHVEEKAGIQGRPVRQYSRKEVGLAAGWLANYQTAHQDGLWGIQEVQAEIQRLTEVIRTHISDPNLMTLLDRYAEKFITAAAGASLPVVGEHGDFTPHNVLINRHKEIQVTHWDYALPSGNPLMDAGAFYLALLTWKYGSRSFGSRPVGGTAIGEFADRYCQKIEVPIHLSPGYYVLRAIEREIGLSPLNPRNYVSYEKWMKVLRPSLAYGLRMTS